ADAAEIGGSLQTYKMGELAQAITLASTRNLTSKTFLVGASDFFAASTGDEKALERLSKSLVSAITPGMLRAIRNFQDVTKRETDPGADPEQGAWSELRVYMNLLRAQTPNFAPFVPGSRTLPPHRNLWAEPVEIPRGWGPDWLSPV